MKFTLVITLVVLGLSCVLAANSQHDEVLAAIRSLNDKMSNLEAENRDLRTKLESNTMAGQAARMRFAKLDPKAAPTDFPPKGPSKPSGKGQFIPYGKHVPRQAGVNYYIATGRQECAVCSHIVSYGEANGANFYDQCTGLTADEYIDMCRAQQKVLQSCPEYVNNWCYQDLGGTQALRSPCPAELVCHYCLGLNPLHCVDA